MSTASLHEDLARWQAAGLLRPLDAVLARFCERISGETDPVILLLAALVSHQLGAGHSCLLLDALLASPHRCLRWRGEDGPASWLAELDAKALAERLSQSALVQAPNAPIVVDGLRVYLRRYWQFEQDVAQALTTMLNQPVSPPEQLERALTALFGPEPGWQKAAAAVATRGRFTIITGGPGTGKTTTVVKLLALMQQQAVASQRTLAIRLAAPTGKAAARLSESIARQIAALDVSDAVRQSIPSDVATLHRLLGSRPDTRHFRHHAGNPLPLDLLIIDEASMIDLEMMAQLLAALPAHARLVLLGDKDQLASVEAGAVLGELTQDADAAPYTAETWQWLDAHCGALARPEQDLLAGPPSAVAGQTVMLRHSHRFGSGSGIGQLAAAVNRMDGRSARQALTRYGDLELVTSDTSDALLPFCIEGYRPYLEAKQSALDAGFILQAFDQFRLLAAERSGPWGVEALNRRIEAALTAAGLVQADTPWYAGRPVMVTRNDYALGLMNGDVGITLVRDDALRVAFARNDGSGMLHWVLPSRLTACETVYAMTVHKSQGSEFGHAALVLPPTRSPLLTKELVYTAITRARTRFTLFESRTGALEDACRSRVQRASGLTEALMRAFSG
ncbi:exodeoxyribonuclease V subunit alpha [Chitinibacteraceae bacterium HSL-7]